MSEFNFPMINLTIKRQAVIKNYDSTWSTRDTPSSFQSITKTIKNPCLHVSVLFATTNVNREVFFDFFILVFSLCKYFL